MSISIVNKPPWRKKFAFLPVKTIDNKTVWLRHVYSRQKYTEYEAMLYFIPEPIYNRQEYILESDLLEMKLRGEM